MCMCVCVCVCVCVLAYTGRRKKNACFSNNCNFLYFQYKKIILTPKQPAINAVLITYIDYSITENYRVVQKERISFRRCPVAPHAHQIYLPAISFFGVASNQKSTFENLVQSTI